MQIVDIILDVTGIDYFTLQAILLELNEKGFISLFYEEETRYYKITDKFLITNYDLCKITITGNEALENVTVYDINPFYNVVDSAKASATC